MDLGPTSMNAELARQIIKAKALAQRNRTARNRTLFTGIMIGVSVSAALYVLGFGTERFYENGALCGASVAGLYIYIVGRRKTNSSSCPVCRHCWEIREGRSVRPEDDMTNWSSCPGCQIQMDDHTLQRDRG
jgi:hypothetical protein